MSIPLQIALVGAGSVSRAHTKGVPLLSERVTLSAISSRNAYNARALAEENFNTIACIDAIAESLRTGTTVKVVSV